MKKLFLLLALVATLGLLSAQILAWEFNTLAGNEVSVDATTNDANLATSVITRGAGLNASALGNAYSATNYTASGTKADAITNNKYFEFSIAPNTGYEASLSTLDANFRRSSTGPNAFAWQYSLDAFATSGVAIGSDVSYTGTDKNGLAQTQISLSGITALQDVASGTTITIRLYGWGASATTGTFALGRLAGNDLAIGGTVESTSGVPTPTITVMPATLTDFSYVFGNGPSPEQSFIVTGTDLDENISVTASADYEISTGTGGSFSATSPITLTQNGGNVSEVTIYVRLKAGLSVGDYINEEITATSAGAGDKTVICTGEVTAPPRPEAPVATAATDIDDVSFIANWEAVNDVTGYYLDVYTKVAGANATDLFISEYIEGNSNNKAIEIYNGTGADVDLSDYIVYLYSNGASDPTNNLPLDGILADRDVYVIANAGSVANILDIADITSTVTYFNGDDALSLYKISTDSYVDIFGVIGDRPTNAWTGEGGYTTLDKTLVRKSDVYQGITENPTGTGTDAFTTLTTEWDMYDIDTFTYLGSHDFDGGFTKTYVHQNLNVGNVTSYAVTGLAPETTYYYVVRAYKDYQTHMLASVNSNEISVTTEATEDSQVVVNGEGDDTVTGATLIVGGAIPDDLLGPDTGIPAVIYTITSSGIKDVLVNRHSSFGNVTPQ